MYELKADACSQCVTVRWTSRFNTLVRFVLATGSLPAAVIVVFLLVQGENQRDHTQAMTAVVEVFSVAGVLVFVALFSAMWRTGYGPISSFVKLWGASEVYACLDENGKLHLHPSAGSVALIVFKQNDGWHGHGSRTAVLRIWPTGVFRRYDLVYDRFQVGPENCWRAGWRGSSEPHVVRIKDNLGSVVTGTIHQVLGFINRFPNVLSARYYLEQTEKKGSEKAA